MDNGSETLSLVNLTQTLLDSIAKKDWDVYMSLCDEKLSCIEPETFNSYYEGLEFHKTFFDSDISNEENITIKENILQPTIKTFGEISIICYKRVQQIIDKKEKVIKMNTFSETRVWRRLENGFKLVHFHKS
jgi:alcohol dehydrogenase YqhD (iron-dependent ADH family)